jgi:RNA polymerase sigma factor (sigma-70 family)
MAANPMSVVIQQLRTAFGRDVAEMTDGELLTLFLNSRDDAALAALVRRHASMVWGVCNRLLRSHHDAEDAFQATFLVLVRKGASVVPREMVGNWLYGVAHQTAVRLRAMAAKKGARERQVVNMPEPVVEEARSNDLLSLLDQELNCLPEKYQALIVLCELESKTRKEVARQLGIPENTVASRLARARAMLAKRLARRGVTVSGGVLGIALSQGAASASAPATLVASTIKAASLMAAGQAVSAGLISVKVVSLTEGVVKAMFVTKIKSVLTVLLVGGVILGGAVVGVSLFNDRTIAFGGHAPLHADQTPAKEEAMPAKPQVFTGTIKKPQQDALKVATVIGRHGVLLIRSEARWDEIKKLAPELTPDAPLPKLDFAKQSVILIFAMGDSSNNTLTLDKSDLTANPPELDYSFRWYNGDVAGLEHPSIKFIHAVIPATPVVNVTLTSLPTVVGRARSVTEFSALLGGKDGGDTVDGLQSTITPKAAKINPGEDILIDFALHLADPGKTNPEHFGTTRKSVFVWDGKYSNGYRNHAFFVTTPDGKTTLLRPKVISDWDKNAPHPVAITANGPYHLPNWVEGETFKSLKSLGLDTTTPGTYTITGLYEETDKKVGNLDSKMWGGSITSNTITVEVKKENADPENLIRELSSVDGNARVAATAELFRRGKVVLPDEEPCLSHNGPDHRLSTRKH